MACHHGFVIKDFCAAIWNKVFKGNGFSFKINEKHWYSFVTYPFCSEIIHLEAISVGQFSSP